MEAGITITQGSHYRIEMASNGSGVTLKILGVVNEDVNFNKVIEVLIMLPSATHEIKFDLANITNINSVGIRGWLLFLEKVQARFAIRILQVNEALIEQAGIVPNVLGKAGTPVEWFDAPYFCAKCNQRVIKVLSTQKVMPVAGRPKLPDFSCSTCKGPLEFDALPDEYFNFLIRAQS